MSYEKDLIVLVADLDAENAIIALLDRSPSLGAHDIAYDLIRHTEHDPGCCKSCVEMLRRHQTTHARALVLFDRHGSGRDCDLRQDIELSIEDALRGSGWNDRAAVVVLDPELEIWVWSDSPHVCSSLGWENRRDLDAFLLQEGWIGNRGEKPSRPKEAMRAVLRQSRTAVSARIFSQLAKNVSLNRCTDRAFSKLKTTLRDWFPENR